MVAPLEHTPEWLLGENVDGSRQFVMHTAKPAFVAEIFDEGDPHGILGEVSFACPSGQSLSRFYWYDDPVTDEQAFIALCMEAARFIEQYDRICDGDLDEDDE